MGLCKLSGCEFLEKNGFLLSFCKLLMDSHGLNDSNVELIFQIPRKSSLKCRLFLQIIALCPINYKRLNSYLYVLTD